ncbi:hypothetical protein [Microbacterium sp. gxy059]|uniref:hypothetical protein n=1 Tax=Microbacterium sp. gxy059 TaxID=2957199 RepID=UPI003D98A1F5
MTVPDRLSALARSRRRARVWGIAIGIPLALVGLALVAKILTMYAFAHQTLAAYDREDAPAAVAAAESQQAVNLFERWRAPYNLGTSLALADRLPEARGALESALDLASGLDVCPVGINLALVIERQGLAAQQQDPDQSAAHMADALAVLDALPEECASEEAAETSPDPERDPDQMMTDLRERLEQAPPPPDPSDDPSNDEEPEGPEGPEDDKLGQLEEQLEKGAEQREARDQRGDGDGENDGFPEGDKPW